MEKARCEVYKPGYIVSWYNRLQIRLKTYGITLKNLYNFDETGFRIGEREGPECCFSPGKFQKQY
jgi:hypothetical protein